MMLVYRLKANQTVYELFTNVFVIHELNWFLVKLNMSSGKADAQDCCDLFWLWEW